VISLDDLRSCVANPPEWVSQDQVSVGCDFAAGAGDYCCMAIARGNQIEINMHDWYWRHDNPKTSAARFVKIFKELGLRGDQISGDADGLGVGFLWDLREAGYYIKEVHNGSPARNDEVYANLASEWWDMFGLLVKNRRIIVPDNEQLLRQLSDRDREETLSGGRLRTKVESKSDMRSRGVSSPDIGDAVVMAMLSGWGGQLANIAPGIAAGTSAGMEKALRMQERAIERAGGFRSEPPIDWNQLR
jgi:hypothetical protein